MKKLVLSLSLLLNLIFTSNAQWYSRAETLFLENNFEEAILYFHRSKFDLEIVPDSIDLNLRIIQCNNRLNQYQLAYQQATAQNWSKLNKTKHQQYRYEAALAAYQMGRYNDALFQFTQLQINQPDSTLHPYTLMLKAMTAIQLQNTEVAVNMVKYLQSKIEADSITMQNANIKADILINEIESTKFLSHSKSSWLATLIPGSGLLYAGEFKEGFTSAALQILSLAFTAVAVYHQLYFTAYGYGLTVLQQFYFGGIRRTEYITTKVNETRKNQLINNLTVYLNEYY